MQRDLLEWLCAIEELMERDFADGVISNELSRQVRKTGCLLEMFCRSRWFRPMANRRLREAWSDFRDALASAKIEKPYHGYEFSICSKPSDFGLDDKLRALMRALI